MNGEGRIVQITPWRDQLLALTSDGAIYALQARNDWAGGASDGFVATLVFPAISLR